MEWLIQAGYVDCVLSGNAVLACHVVEADILALHSGESGWFREQQWHGHAGNQQRKSHGSIVSDGSGRCPKQWNHAAIFVGPQDPVYGGLNLHDDGTKSETITDVPRCESTPRCTMVVMVVTATI